MGFLDYFKKQNSKPAALQKRGWQAARVDRLTSTFFAHNLAINEELRGDLDPLRARSRTTAKNNDYGKKFVNMVVANVVGPNGFNFQARTLTDSGEADLNDNASLERALAKWGRKGVCDITGRLSLLDIESAVLRSLATDGEYLVRQIRGKAARNPFNYALQLIDVDRLDTKLNQNATANQNAIIMGIEVDEYRRPLFYHIFTSHPNGNAQTTRMRERIPASDILHGFIQETPEQVRGTPWMAASLLTLHHLGEFEQSALLAARKGANTLGFFVSPDGQPPVQSDADGVDIDISVPGEYDTLPDGYDFRPYDSKYPDAMLGAFTKSFLRRISSGLNVAYNSLANDLEGVSFSSIRSGVIEEREQWMTIQGWFIESFLIPVYEEWLSMSLLSGAITNNAGFPLPASKIEKFKSHQWQGRRWQWVDPLRDIEASIAAINNNLTDPYTIASQMGLDLDDVMTAIARANKAAEANGLPRFGASPAAMPPAANNNDATNLKSVKNEILRAIEKRDVPAAPAVNIHQAPINITTPEVRVDNHLPASEVRVDSQPVVVNVAAPEVSNTINVEPTPIVAEVNIDMPAPEITLDMPARQTITTLNRNDKGEMTGSTAIETNL